MIHHCHKVGVGPFFKSHCPHICDYNCMLQNYQRKKEYGQDITIQSTCFGTLRQPWGKLALMQGSTRYTGVQTYLQVSFESSLLICAISHSAGPW